MQHQTRFTQTPFKWGSRKFRSISKIPLNPSSYIDYSSPPHQEDLVPKHVLVNVCDTVSIYSSFTSLTPIYDHFPLRDMIGMVLSHRLANDIPGYDGVLNDHYFSEVEYRLGAIMQHVDIDALFMLFEGLVENLDSEIAHRFPQYITTGMYQFASWIDGTTILLTTDY